MVNIPEKSFYRRIETLLNFCVGAATVSHPSPNYFYDNALCAFDCLALMIQNTITVEEIKFAVDAIRHKVPIIFVKSHMDAIYKNMVDDGIIDTEIYVTPQQQADKAVELCNSSNL